MDGSLVVPSSGLSGLIVLSIGKISFSLGSEVGGLSDLVVSLSELSSVNGDSLVALVKGLLADTHEVSVSGDLVFLVLMGIGHGFMALLKDVVEHTEDSLHGALVGEVLGQSEHNLDHLGPLGSVGEVFQELLDVVLSFGDLYERGLISQLGDQLDALVQSGDGVGELIDHLLVVSVLDSSLGDGVGHVLSGGVDQVVVVGDLGGELVHQWDENVVDVVGSLGDIGVGRGDSTGDRGGQDVVVVGLKSPFLHFHISLELEISEERSEGSLQLIKRTTKFNLKFDECGCDLSPASFLELLDLVLNRKRHLGGVGGAQYQSNDDDSSFHFDFFGFFI